MKTQRNLIGLVGVLLALAGGTYASTILNTGTGSTYTYQQNLNNNGQILTDAYYNYAAMTYWDHSLYPTDIAASHVGPVYPGEYNLILKFAAPSGYQINSVALNFSYNILSNVQYSDTTSTIAASFWSYDPVYWDPVNGNNGDFGPWDYLYGTPGQTPTALLNYTASDAAANNPTNVLQWVTMNQTITGGTDSVVMAFYIHSELNSGFFNIANLFPTGGDGTPGLTATLGVSAIPEPATFGLLALGGLALLRRRRG